MLAITALLTFVTTACSDSDDTEENPGVEEKDDGKTDVVEEKTGHIDLNMDDGSATPDNPATVTSGQPLTLALTQTSTYNDPDGTVFTCQPKATVKLSVAQDTLRVKDLKTLTAMTQTATQQSSGTNPCSHQNVQTFNLGGQKIVFDLSHEVYTYVNSLQHTIEMPYASLSAAKYGAATPAETRAQATAIRLTPLTPTRGTYITETPYQVRVSFTVDVTTANTDAPQTRTLSFEADYVGIVEDTHEYPDPQTTFSYTVSAQGTANRQSPFTMNSGTQQMQVQWQQVAQYSWFSLDDMEQRVATAEPRAHATITMETDTVWSTSADDFTVITQEGNTFHIGTQTVTVDYDFDSQPTVEAGGQTISMPHLELGAPEVKSVVLTELPDVVIPHLMYAVTYEVTVTLSQTLTPVNAANPTTQTIEYVVKYIGVEEVKLAKVTYRKDWEWLLCEDEWSYLAHFAIVYRDRTYTNGVTITDTFRDYGHYDGCSEIMFAPEPYAEKGGERICEGVRYVYSPPEYIGPTNDSAFVRKLDIGVPDITKVQWDDYWLDDGYDPFPGEWSKYTSDSKSYIGLDVPLDGVDVSGAECKSEQPSGWYWYKVYYSMRFYIKYKSDELNLSLLGIHLRAHFMDQYLSIDGQLISFADAFGPIYHESTEELTTLADGTPAKVFTCSLKSIFMGKELSGTAIITFYQLSDSQAAPQSTQPATAPQRTWPKADAWQPSFLPRQPSFIYGGDFRGRGAGRRYYTPQDDLRQAIREGGVKVEIK